MNEEEKKAIKWLKELYDIEKDFNSSAGKEESNIIKTLLNLIEKQQKEIEELKSQLDFIDEQNRYIDKLEKEIEELRDKIREIIGKYINAQEHFKYENQELYGKELRNMIKELLEV